MFSFLNRSANEIYKGSITFSISDHEKTVSIAEKLHLTFAYDRMLQAQQFYPDCTMTITFKGTFKGKDCKLTYRSFQDFEKDMQKQSLINTSRLIYKR